MIIVTAAVIIKDNRVLISQRQEGNYMEYRWEFPGGKLERGETPEECIVREIREELNMDIKPMNLYKVIDFKHNNKDMKLIAFISKLIRGEGAAIECNDFKWITRYELDMYDFTPADIPITEKLKNDNLLS